MDILKNFGDRLTELMNEKAIKSDELGRAIGVSGSTVRQWKRGLSDICVGNLIKLADYFVCSIEYLTGRSDDYLSFLIKPIPQFASQLRSIMKLSGQTRYSMNRDTKFKDNYFYNWDRGHMPKLSTLIELADILDCSIDFLVGREN